MKGWISPGTNKLVSPSLFHSPVAVAAVGLKLQEHHFSTGLDLKRTRETMLQHFTYPLDYKHRKCWSTADYRLNRQWSVGKPLHPLSCSSGAASPLFRCAQMVPLTQALELPQNLFPFPRTGHLKISLGPTQFLYSKFHGLLKLIFHTNQYSGA